MKLSITQAAEYLEIHPDTLRRWEKKGLIKSKRVGKRKDRRFEKDDLDQIKVELESTQTRKEMENFVLFMITVSNLRNIPRYGPLLFSGIQSSSVPEHIHLVTIIVSALMDDFRALGYEINGERLLKVVITHDLAESVLGDIPTASPSYRSFFDIDIRDAYKRAEKKAVEELMLLVENKSIHEREEDLTDIEKDLLKIADTMARLFELVDLKFRYRHEWINMMWNNSIKQLSTFTEDYNFISEIILALEDTFSRRNKAANPLLTKKRFNKPRNYKNQN